MRSVAGTPQSPVIRSAVEQPIRRLRPCLAALGATVCALILLSAAKLPGEDMKSIDVLEWVAFLPWTHPGVKDPVVTIPTLAGPGETIRIPPVVATGAEATWFVLVDGTMVRNYEEKTTVITANFLGFETVVGMVCLPEGEAVVLGGKKDHNRLIRMGSNGNIVWEHLGAARVPDENPVELTGRAPRLVADDDGTIFLIAASGEQCAKLDPATGYRTAVRLIPALRGPAFLRNNTLYRVMMSAGVRTWAKTPLGTENTTVTSPKDPTLDLLSIRQATPDGGALLGTQQGFTWLLPDGSTTGIPLLSLVRNGNRPVGLLNTQDGLMVVSPGQKAVKLPLDGPDVGLVSATNSGFVVEQRDDRTDTGSGKWHHFDRQGHKISITPPGNWLEQGGRMDFTTATVERTGDILVVGTDAGGAYVVRIKKP